VLHEPAVFGAELRRLRIRAGLTLSQFAAAVHYSKSQLSKIENGLRRPTPEFARLCDAVLGTGGTLARLVPAVKDRRGARTPADRPKTPGRRRTAAGVLRSYDDGRPTRRQVMAVGAASVLAVAPLDDRIAAHVPGLGSADPDPGPDPVATYRDLFTQFRRVGQLSPPHTLLPVLAEQTRCLRDLSDHCAGRTKSGLLNLAARHAEFAGWMAQESGDDEAALDWTEHAVRLADAAGDRVLSAYALTRRALISYYAGDATETISLASGALSPRVPARIRGFAAQHVGQGHALAGDHTACLRHLEQARCLLESEAPDPDTPRLGPSNLDDPITMITGWCLLDLGRPRQAAELLDACCERLPPHALRTRARYGIRRALAHARAGEVEHACSLARELLPAVRAADSATIRLDLRRLARTLARFRSVPAVASLSPDLTAALHPTVQ